MIRANPRSVSSCFGVSSMLQADNGQTGHALHLLRPMLRRAAVLPVAVLALGLGVKSVRADTDATTSRTPNLVFILADDLGWSDTTLFGTTKFYQDAQHRTAGESGNGLHPSLLGQPPMFADPCEYHDGPEPGTHRNHRARVPCQADPDETDGCGIGAPVPTRRSSARAPRVLIRSTTLLPRR